MANPYIDRMEQLDSKRTTANYRQLSEMVGLPINRPGQQASVASPSGVPTGNTPLPQEDDSYKQSTFWQNFDYHRQNDEHFDGFTEELTKLATGLRQQVQNGYMPQAIAEDNIRQFIGDTTQRRAVADPHIQRQKAQDAQGAILQQLAQQATQNPTADSPMAQQAAQAQADAAQQAKDNPPAIRNLSEEANRG